MRRVFGREYVITKFNKFKDEQMSRFPFKFSVSCIDSNVVKTEELCRSHFNASRDDVVFLMIVPHAIYEKGEGKKDESEIVGVSGADVFRFFFNFAKELYRFVVLIRFCKKYDTVKIDLDGFPDKNLIDSVWNTGDIPEDIIEKQAEKIFSEFLEGNFSEEEIKEIMDNE